MIWCLIFMLLGAFVFGAGIVFEKIISADETETEPDERFFNEEDINIRRQWENLLEYDGTRQEEFINEDR